MFVCDPCLRKHFTNEPSFSQSHGPCEMCRNARVCSDIPSFALRNRSKPRKKKPPKKNAALEARARVREEFKPRKQTALERMEKALKDED